MKNWYMVNKDAPIYWDRLVLVIFGNIMLAMAFIEAMSQEWEGAIFGFAWGIILHFHYWHGGRFLIKLSDE